MLNLIRILIVIAVILLARYSVAQERPIERVLPNVQQGALLDRLSSRIEAIESRERQRDKRIEGLAGDVAQAVAGYLKVRAKLEIYRIVGGGLSLGCPLGASIVIAAFILRRRTA